MKSSLIMLSVPAALAASQVEKRQGKGASVCFVWARGSLEPGSMGLLIGPELQTALKIKFPSMKTYPVMYAASITTNISVARTDPASISKGVAAFKEATSAGCQTIVAGGYSQGAAVMHNVIEKSLDQSTKDKIAGVALFGDTRNKQDGGHIKNFPAEKSKVWCNATDGVCGGNLAVGLTHLAYASEANGAAKWLSDRVAAHNKAGSSSGGDNHSSNKDSGKGESQLSGLLSKLGNGGSIDLSGILSKLGGGNNAKEGNSDAKEGSNNSKDRGNSGKSGNNSAKGGKDEKKNGNNNAKGQKDDKKDGTISLSGLLSKLGSGSNSGGSGGSIDLSAILSKIGSGNNAKGGDGKKSGESKGSGSSDSSASDSVDLSKLSKSEMATLGALLSKLGS